MKRKLGILCKILYAIALGALVPPEALLPAPVWAAIAQAPPTPRPSIPQDRPAAVAAPLAPSLLAVTICAAPLEEAIP